MWADLLLLADCFSIVAPPCEDVLAYMLLCLCINPCSYEHVGCQETWLGSVETGETCSEDRQILGAASPQ